MKQFNTAAIAIAAVVFLAPAFAQSPLSEGEARKIAVDMAGKFDAAYNRHDATSVAALYAKSGIFVPAHRPHFLSSFLTGRRGIEKFFASAFNEFSDQETKIDDAGPLGSGESIWYIAEVHLSGQGQNAPISFDGVEVATLVRNGSDWEYRIATVSPRPKE
jgi:ketosteroid isomerase-like protein